MPSLVSCSTWVRRGASKSKPDRIALRKDELEKVIKELKEDMAELDEDGSDTEGANTADSNRKRKTARQSDLPPGSIGGETADSDINEDGSVHRQLKDVNDEDDDIVTAYGLDDYDNEATDGSAWDTVAGLTYYASNDDDPYLTVKEEDDVSDREDFEVKPTDNLIVAGRAAPECSVLEVYVYNETEGSLFCHHDMILPAFPLAVEWINYDPGEGGAGNLVAVGSMEPTIDLWDLDVVDTIEPAFTLGSKRSKRKKKKKGTVGGHADAVLDLAWNHLSKTVLASASADATCGLWDLEKGKLVASIAHDDKVQTLRWHPCEAETLLTGSFDETVRVYDCRSPAGGCKKWKLDGEVERSTWDSFSPYYFFASTEKGYVFYVDTRKDTKPVFTLSAHAGAVTGLVQSSEASTCLLTTSADGLLKIWDVANNKPGCILEKNMNMGELHCLSRCPEAGFVYAIGSEKELRVWDVRESAAVRQHFCAPAKDSSADFGLNAMTLSADPADSDDEEINEFFENEENVPNSTSKSSQAAASQGAQTTSSDTNKRKKKKAKRKKKKENV